MRFCPHCFELYAEHAAFCPMDGVALVVVTDPLVGKTIAQRYRVVKRLGGGGMSSVYLAQHVMIERLSAIKVLRSELSSSESQRDRFVREARAANRIHHENIVEVTDFGEWEHLLYLVMEYIPGDALSTLLAEGPISWQRTAAIAVQLASALSRVHQAGVVHRDLKPGNVLLVKRDAGEVAMVCDFGIARILDAPSLTLTSQLVGTPGYIAPEVIGGGEAGPKADLFALGVLLYECLAGRSPYDDRSPTPLMLQVLRDPVRSLSSIGVKVPGQLEALVMKMLERRPDDRPRNAFEVQDELSSLLRAHEVYTAGTLYLGEAERSAREPMLSEPDAASSRPFGHLAPLCAAGLSRIEGTLARGGHLTQPVAVTLDRARALTGDVNVAAHAVSLEQARIEELERYGRTLRKSFGRALDDLCRDLARVERRREEVSRRRAEALSKRGERKGEAPAMAWEQAALIEEEMRAQALSDELSTQVQALREHLKGQNETLEAKLTSARSALEGRVAALRTLASEAWLALDEVGHALGLQALPAETLPGTSLRRLGH